MKCPLDGNTDVVRIGGFAPADIAEQWQRSKGIDLGSVFRGLPKIEYWRCNTTGLCWYSPPEAAGGGELYSQLERFDWYYMPDKWEFQVALGLLEADSRILEVGVGEGHFLQAALKRGQQPVGVELNPTAAARVRRLGFEVHEVKLEELSKMISDPFDAVCSYQVLEHVPNPGEFIAGMLSVLRPGGKVILSVPNAAVMKKIDPKNNGLLNQPPHHMSHWDEGVFRSLEKIFPVRVLSVHREPLASYHVSWFLNGYLRALLAPLGALLPRLLVNRYSTLPIQWMMLAGARKWFPGHTLLVELEYRPK